MPSTRRSVVHRGEVIPNLFERTTSTGRVVYELRRKVEGRSLRRALTATTTTDAIREARSLTATIDLGVRLVGRNDVSLVELRDLYAEWTRARESIADSTRGLYLGCLDRHVLPALRPSTKVADVRPAHVRLMIEKLTAEKLSGSTVRGCVTALSALMRFAVHRELVDRNPCRELERGDRPSGKRRTEPRYLDATQIRELLAALGDEFRPIAACCAFAGVRVSEALALTWADVDLDTGMLHVPGTKTAASKDDVPMIPELVAELRAHRARVASQSLSRCAKGSLVFTTSTGLPQHRKNVLRAVWRAGKTAGLNDDGLERVGVHDLRHSCAGLLLAAGVPMPKVAAVLRHSNPRITADVYAGLVETERAKLGDDLAAAFGSSR